MNPNDENSQIGPSNLEVSPVSPVPPVNEDNTTNKIEQNNNIETQNSINTTSVNNNSSSDASKNSIPNNVSSNNLDTNKKDNQVTNDSTNNFRVKSNNKKITIIVFLIIIGLVIFFLLANTNIGKKITNNITKNNENEIKIIKVDTKTSWGDKYALAIQETFPELESYSVIFLDFLFDATPEMAVKYLDANDKETIRIFQLNNDEVSESKDFRNSEFKMVYTIKDKVSKWYIYINSATSKKYGSYTLVEKLLNRTALGADIKTTTDVEITTFNVNYITANYRPTFYKIEKKSFEKDFKNAVSMFSKNNEEIEQERNRIASEYSDVTINDNLDQKDSFSVGEFTLKYGEYVTLIDVYKEGEVTGTREEQIIINKDGTITTPEDKTVKFTVNGKIILLENGVNFKVKDNNIFLYGPGEGQEYKLRGQE